MTLFLISFAIIALVITLMSIGVIFGRGAIKGSCGGVNKEGECLCLQKCERRRKLETIAQSR